ncbi:MAG: bifunctional riboflavin kinase/FAD synthetase [Candidatus Omnitrophica bacterium]|nr:bifunctional riboflavin kinase/FAD synthetase [Candidatus Omnitrophota bacterium]
MKVISEVPYKVLNKKGLVLAIGVFDGVHRGHQRLLKEVVKTAKRLCYVSGVITFDPHPIQILNPAAALPLVIPLKERLKLIASLGIKACMVVNFTKSLSGQSGGEFLEKYILSRFALKAIIVGEDFRFGSGKGSSIDDMIRIGKEKGFAVKVVKLSRKRKHKIGSSTVRHHISLGELSEARKLLGRSYSVFGKVEKGYGRGKVMGFPTANISSEGIVLPPDGVYAVFVRIDKEIYSGMASIGYRPTFESSKTDRNIEVFIFDFSRDIYKKEIEIIFAKRLRDEVKFASSADLIAEMKKDKIAASKILKRITVRGLHLSL